MDASEREAVLNWLRAHSERMKREDEDFRAGRGLATPVEQKNTMWKLGQKLKEFDRKFAALQEAHEQSMRESRARCRRQEGSNG